MPRILIVDDSDLFRRSVRRILESHPAIAAGYSPKNASQFAHQAFASLKVPDMLNNAGYSIPVIIEKHLAPKLSAKTAKLAVDDGC